MTESLSNEKSVNLLPRCLNFNYQFMNKRYIKLKPSFSLLRNNHRLYRLFYYTKGNYFNHYDDDSENHTYRERRLKLLRESVSIELDSCRYFVSK